MIEGRLQQELSFDPLDMPASVRLKINANSTRQVSWEVKMTFSHYPSPILIPLGSVISGGVNGKLSFLATHVKKINDWKKFN